ncbi:MULTISPECIES: THUMP domain-containing protein [unclassified Achromobacter]|uniref:THUMP domain-containing protein n=1 Tax=unclassified Achromobacter TaxID=2626865 RepID=UPI000B51A0E6|nr:MULTISPECIES: THUMP domain-containing protein [unclassified Achromobacter]OWT77428.1 DNA methyltransferase [Achromobacter sp. HZ28]OWT78309.1 DNA methyltransferase [Achromobacter sp. HZ34]
MTADDPDRPRKTLSVKKSPRPAEASDAGGPPRKRSGARARAAAQVERSRDQQERSAAAEEREIVQDADARVSYVRSDSQDYRGERSGGYDAGDRGERRSGHGAGDRGERRSGYGAGDRGERREANRDGGERAPRARQAADDRHGDHAARGGDRNRAETPDEGAYTGRVGRHDDGRYGDADYGRRVRERHEPRRHERYDRNEIYTVFTPCPQGIEEALTAELQALGFDDAEAGRAGARFSTDWQGIQRANLYSRLATRVLVQVAHGPVQHEDDLMELAYNTPWERWFGAEHSLRVDTSAIKSPMRSLQFCNLRVKDGICDRLTDREGARPDIDTVRPDARVFSFLTQDTATLYLDTSGESLFKRGWRLDKGEAPLRENLAAGMLALAGWDPSEPLLDPFCGSGTILIEAAWIALGVPPGIARPFGFERMRDFDSRRWRDLKDDARAHIRPQLETPLYGCDLNPDAIAFARNNAERAWLTEDTIQFEVADARSLEAPAKSGWIVTNPPYGERLEAGAEADLWRDWASCLKKQFGGWQLHVISSDMTLPQQLRLKPARRTPLYNGALDCRLFSFELVEAGYRDTDRAQRRTQDPKPAEDDDQGED